VKLLADPDVDVARSIQAEDERVDELHRQVAEQMYTKLVHHDTPRYTMYSVDTDVHQPSTLCRDLGVNLGLSFGGPCLGHKFFSLRLSSPRERLRGTDSHGSHVPAPPGDFLPVPVSQTCSDSETVQGTCCVWEVGTGNWFRSLQLINLSGRWASCW
jgi:hypothetical protein